MTGKRRLRRYGGYHKNEGKMFNARNSYYSNSSSIRAYDRYSCYLANVYFEVDAKNGKYYRYW